MRDYHETTVDKFMVKVAKDRWYNSEGIWEKEEGGIIRIGLSDFLQQRSGDIAFAEVKQIGIRHPPLRPKRKSPACHEFFALARPSGTTNNLTDLFVGLLR